MIRALLVLLALGAGPLSAQCRMALAIGLDVSSSVDAAEHSAQLSGLSAALRDPVALMVHEWSGRSHQSVLVPYFQAEVIHGPGAFVEVATDYADYGRAMARKLLREMTLAVSMLETE